MVIAEGTPEAIATVKGSHTGEFLAPLLKGREVPVGAEEPSLLDAAQDPAPVKKTAKRATRKAAASAATPAKATAKKATPRKTAATKTAAARTSTRTPRTPKF